MQLQEAHKPTIPVTGKFLNPEQAFAQARMIDYVAHKRRLFDRVEVENRLPPLDYFGDAPVWVGTFSRTCQAIGEKWILKPTSIRLSVDDSLIVTPSEAARAWIYTNVEKQPRAHRSQFEFWESYDSSYPYLAKAGVYPDMCYLDLKAAYWSILQVVGWGAEYHESIILRRHPVNNFPLPNHKVSRNCLVTACLPTPARVWQAGDLKEMPSRGYVNRGLYKLVIDILHAVAIDMLEFNPVYIHTDGYIIPRKFAEVAERKIDEKWGLLLTERHKGNAIVYGVGEYTIGSHRAGRAKGFVPPHANINHAIPYAMLNRYFRFLSDRFPPVYENA